MENKRTTNLIFAFKLLKKFALKYLISSMLLSVFELVTPIINIYGLKVILDSIQQGKSFEDIMLFILLLFALMIIAYSLSIWYKKWYSPIQVQKISIEMKKFFYEKASQTDLKFFDDTNYYNTYVKALSESENRLFSLINDLSDFIGTISCLITVITLAISMDFLILLFSIFSIILSVILSIITQNFSIKEFDEKVESKRKFEYVDRIFYLYQYAKEVRSFTLKKNLFKMLDNASNTSINVIRRYIPNQVFLSAIKSLCDIIYILGMMMYLTYKTIIGVISIGDFAALLTASQAFSNQAVNLFNIIPKIRENLIHIGYLHEFVNNTSIIESKIGGYLMPFGEAAEIKINNLSFSYANSTNTILYNINETINRGEFIAIVGENGVGKSTLLKLLLRLYDTSEGEIEYNGINIKDYDLTSLRNNIGIVFQDFQHYALTIRENLCFGDQFLDDNILLDVLEKVGLKKRVENLPNGLNTIIGYEFDQNGVEFSGGELQRLALARAILLKQGIIIMDEPSSSLDPNSEKNFFDNIKDLCVGKTAIIVTHRLAVARYADKIILIKNGIILERGSHEELMELNGEYSEMFKKQAKHFSC